MQGPDGPRLRFVAGQRELIRPDGDPLYTTTRCDVSVQLEHIPEGAMLHYRIRNRTDQVQDLPHLFISGIQIPREGIKILENWKHVYFKSPLMQRDHHMLHARRSYPTQIYSPVMGMRHDGTFLASSLKYDVFASKLEVNLDYRWDRRRQSWSMQYRFWSDLTLSEFDEQSSSRQATLEPGGTLRMTVAVTTAPPGQWYTAFRPYRDFFRERFGSVRYDRSHEPIMAISLGHAGLLAADNPRGYNSTGAAGRGRMDQVGWRSFHDRTRQEIMPMGYRRVMFWQVSGSYRQHRHDNMVWEIMSAWPPAMRQTRHELIGAISEGLTVGLWWGRAFTISEGFDSGRRHAWDPDNPADNQAAFRELDEAYDMGIRLIGLDAVRRAIAPTPRAPSSEVAFKRIFPMLYERYPEMQWIIEPAACDYLHLWGSSFVWSREVGGPNEFADYLIPGNEVHPVFKLDRPPSGQDHPHAHMNIRDVNQMIDWGYTPIVFSAPRFRLHIDRSLIHERTN